MYGSFAIAAAQKVAIDFVATRRERLRCAPHEQRELNSTPGATERLGDSGSATLRLRRCQAGEHVATSEATAAAVATAAVTAMEAAAEAITTNKTNKITKTNKATKANKPAKSTKVITKAVKVQDPSARRRQNAAKRPFKWGSKEAGHAGARARGDTAGRGWGLGTTSNSWSFGGSGVMLEGRGPTFPARPRRLTVHSLCLPTTVDEEDAAKSLLELHCQASCVVPVPPHR